ncbi:hypothetical protein Tco_0447597, partial [Tanacetum coccineum]
GNTSKRAEGGNTSNKVLTLETAKDVQATKIITLKTRIKKLKQKNAFDDLDADGRDYMETKDVVKEGRQSTEAITKDKGSGEKRGSTEELVSTVVHETVSTARPDVDAARKEDS